MTAAGQASHPGSRRRPGPAPARQAGARGPGRAGVPQCRQWTPSVPWGPQATMTDIAERAGVSKPPVSTTTSNDRLGPHGGGGRQGSPRRLASDAVRGLPGRRRTGSPAGPQFFDVLRPAGRAGTGSIVPVDPAGRTKDMPSSLGRPAPRPRGGGTRPRRRDRLGAPLVRRRFRSSRAMGFRAIRWGSSLAGHRNGGWCARHHAAGKGVRRLSRPLRLGLVWPAGGVQRIDVVTLDRCPFHRVGRHRSFPSPLTHHTQGGTMIRSSHDERRRREVGPRAVLASSVVAVSPSGAAESARPMGVVLHPRPYPSHRRRASRNEAKPTTYQTQRNDGLHGRMRARPTARVNGPQARETTRLLRRLEHGAAQGRPGTNWHRPAPINAQLGEFNYGTGGPWHGRPGAPFEG